MDKWKLKLVYTVLVLAALVYAERRLIEPRLTGARLSALVYKVLVYQEWHLPNHEMITTHSPALEGVESCRDIDYHRRWRYTAPYSKGVSLM